jgi:hypothetical protein
MQDQQDQKNHHPAQRAYSAPQLIGYGRVRDLTAGGSGTKGEFKPNQGTRHP